MRILGGDRSLPRSKSNRGGDIDVWTLSVPEFIESSSGYINVRNKRNKGQRLEALKRFVGVCLSENEIVAGDDACDFGVFFFQDA